jgi:hypothetical protein
MKAYWGVEEKHHTFLTSALDGGEWSATRHSRFTPRGKSLPPGIHWMGGWVGSTASLDAVEKRKNYLPLPEI